MMNGDPDDTFSEAHAFGDITWPQTVTSVIEAGTDVDMYRFQAAAGQKIAFDIDTLENGVPGLGSYLRVFDSTGRQLAANNDRQAPDEPQPKPGESHEERFFDSYIDYVFHAEGTYYVGVSNWQHRYYHPITGADSLGSDPDHLTGNYQLTLSSPGFTDLKLGRVWWQPSTPAIPATRTASVIRLEVTSTGYTGKVDFSVYQSSDAVRDGNTDVGLARGYGYVRAGQTVRVSLVITSPPKPSVAPNYVLVEVDPYHRLDFHYENNVAALNVRDPRPLSFELQSEAPLANTRLDRVELWLRTYRQEILAVAAARGIDPRGIAGAIAWEAIYNVKPQPLAAPYGPGKVHPIERDFLPACSETVEEWGYVPNRTLLGRVLRIRTPEGAIEYIGAIQGAFADVALARGSKANLHARPDVLATLYNGIEMPGAPGTHVRLYNAARYFDIRISAGEKYTAVRMGAWVGANLDYLRRCLEP